jgi:hypothetical protein
MRVEDAIVVDKIKLLSLIADIEFFDNIPTLTKLYLVKKIEEILSK